MYNYSSESSFDRPPPSHAMMSGPPPTSAPSTSGNLSHNGYYEDVDELNFVVGSSRIQSQKRTLNVVSSVANTASIQRDPMIEYDGNFESSTAYQFYATPQGFMGSQNVYDGMNSDIFRTNNGVAYDDGYNGYISDFDVPSAPGTPQIVDLDSDMVVLVWLRPDRSGDSFIGYQVQFRHIGELPWQVANAELVQEPQFAVCNLQTCGQYEFRVIAKNARGFGEPSCVSHPVQLRPKFGQMPISNRVDQNVPFSPGRPRVVESDGTNATICWEPPVASGSGGPIAGYHVEYKVISSQDWISATNYLVKDTKYTVVGLRPNGEYEFRVFAKNADGLSSPSQTSGEVRIRPMVPARSPNYVNASFVGSYFDGIPLPPGQLQITDVDSDTATIAWLPAPSADNPALTHFVLEYREIGDPNWYSASDRPITGTRYAAVNLRPNSTYEFRVFAKNQYGTSEPSEVSEICQLRPKLRNSLSSSRTVPTQPNPPEVMEVYGDCVTICWAPVHSALPLQGYQVEFRDSTHGPTEWLPVNPILMQSCKMTIGDLLLQREYDFRVTAKNAIGYSKPSEASQKVFIGLPTNIGVPQNSGNIRNSGSSFNSDQFTLPAEMNTIKESPPITDNDESPPPLRRPPPVSTDKVSYRDPTLPEVLEYLNTSDSVLQLNASGYLQHLTYHDDAMKHKVRDLNGIPKVIELLRSDVPEIQKNACGCLKNLSFGIDENKMAILNAGGLSVLALLLRKTPDMQVIEEMCGLLWNLSSHDDLKSPIMQHVIDPLIKQIVVPYSGWSPNGMPVGRTMKDAKIHPPAVFRNCTGVLRNVSSANDVARTSMREREGLVDALVCYLRTVCDAKGNEIDTKSVENVVCVLRNLSYRLQEIEDPNYDKQPTAQDRSKSAPSGSPKSKRKGNKSKKDEVAVNPLFKNPNKGIPLLWQTEVIRDYLKLLDQSSNPDTLEASAGAIQNLAACFWQPSIDVRATVRKEKGLPILVTLLSIDNDKVVCASATALRNLALDQRNRELIGKYAMEDLIKKLPSNNSPSKATNISDDTLAAVLSVIYVTTVKSADFTRTLLEKGGIERLVSLSNSQPPSKIYSSRVHKYAAQVLFAIWQHKELHDLYKKAGFKEDAFVSRNVGPASPNYSDTLARPVGTQGVERGRGQNTRVRPDWQDDYSARSRATSTLNVDTPDNFTSFNGKNRTPVNGNRNGHANLQHTPEPIYTQVQKNHRGAVAPQNIVQTVNGANSPANFGGDSWV